MAVELCFVEHSIVFIVLFLLLEGTGSSLCICICFCFCFCDESSLFGRENATHLGLRFDCCSRSRKVCLRVRCRCKSFSKRYRGRSIRDKHPR
jgi:hypothetical protein